MGMTKNMLNKLLKKLTENMYETILTEEDLQKLPLLSMVESSLYSHYVKVGVNSIHGHLDVWEQVGGETALDSEQLATWQPTLISKP